MKKWVCKQCGLYLKVKPNHIRAGQRVYFYKKKNLADRASNQINEQVVVGIVLRKNDKFITVLTSKGVSEVNASDLYLEDAPINFVYNMFGVCEC